LGGWEGEVVVQAVTAREARVKIKDFCRVMKEIYRSSKRNSAEFFP